MLAPKATTGPLYRSCVAAKSSKVISQLTFFSWLFVAGSFCLLFFIPESSFWHLFLCCFSAIFSLFTAVGTYFRASAFSLTKSPSPLRHDLRAMLVFAFLFSFLSFSYGIMVLSTGNLAARILQESPQMVTCPARFSTPSSVSLVPIVFDSHHSDPAHPVHPAPPVYRHDDNHQYGRGHFHRRQFGHPSHPDALRPLHSFSNLHPDIRNIFNHGATPKVSPTTPDAVALDRRAVENMMESNVDATFPVAYPRFGCVIVPKSAAPKYQADGLDLPVHIEHHGDGKGCPLHEMLNRVMRYIPVPLYDAASTLDEDEVQVCSPGLYEYNPLLLDVELADPMPACFDPRYGTWAAATIGVFIWYLFTSVSLVIFLGVLTSIANKFGHSAQQTIMMEEWKEFLGQRGKVEDEEEGDEEEKHHLVEPPAYDGILSTVVVSVDQKV